MKKQLFFLSLGCLLNISAGNAKGLCADGGERPSHVFWNPKVYETTDFTPFYFTFDRLYDYQWDDPAQKYKDNTAEWISYCGGKTDIAGVDAFVYNSELKDIQSAVSTLKSGKSMPAAWRGNTMAEALWAKKDVGALDYLEFAKKCEAFVTTGGDPWEEEETRDKPAMRKLYLEGQAKFEKEKNPFLKLRYAFQNIRLAHYAGDESQAIGMYDKMIAPMQSESVIKYWALAQKAGSLLKSGKKAEGLYWLSVVFEKCPSKRANMYYNFHPENNQEFEGAMKYAKSENEKTTLFLLRAIHPHAQALEEMTNIYRIDPQSEYLSLLLVREINKLEANLFGWDLHFDFPIKTDYSYENFDTESPLSGEYLHKFKRMVANNLAEGKVKDMQLWRMADAYMMYLTGENDMCTKKLITLEQEGRLSPQAYKQVELLKYINSLSYVRSLDKQSEEMLYNAYLKLGMEQKENYADEWEYNFASKPVYALIQHHFIPIYQKQGQLGKAILMKKAIGGFFGKDVQITAIDELLQWVGSPRNSLEEHLQSLITSHQGWERDILLDIKATAYMRRGDFKSALGVFQTVSPDFMKDPESYAHIGFNPFEGFIKDCHDCAADKYTGSEYNKLWMLTKMMDLEKEAQNNPAKSAENYYKLGSAWYNTTYFAPGWRAMAYSRSTAGWDAMGNTEDAPGDYYLDVKNECVYDMAPAIRYYNQALAANPDKELAARIVFMLAKCKLNQTYSAEGDMYAVQQEYKKLKNEYADTRFYKDAIRECGYLRDFVQK